MSQLLHAVYESQDRSFCDVENILFYNVGEGAFRSSCENGLRFERSFDESHPCPIQLSSHPAHYASYSVVDQRSSLHLRSGKEVCRFSISFKKAELQKCSRVWLATKRRADFESSAGEPYIEKPFALRVQMQTEQTIWPAGLLKPLFDGLISALHRHDGTDVVEVTRRLASELGTEANVLQELLHDEQMAVLGERQLLWRRGKNGVQWNPGDDHCLAGEIVVQRSPAVTPSLDVSLEAIDI